MAAKRSHLAESSGESMSPMELASLYGFERSRINWSCPLPAIAEGERVPADDAGRQG